MFSGGQDPTRGLRRGPRLLGLRGLDPVACGRSLGTEGGHCLASQVRSRFDDQELLSKYRQSGSTTTILINIIKTY